MKRMQKRGVAADVVTFNTAMSAAHNLGEHEHAVPARVPTEHIKRYGRVVVSAAGLAYVPRSAWVDNPRFNMAFCKYSLSECGEC